MIRLFKVSLLIVGSIIMLSGCGIINPYHENFECQTKDSAGHCVGMEVAYGVALGQVDFDESAVIIKKQTGDDEVVEVIESDCKDCDRDAAVTAAVNFSDLAYGKRQGNSRAQYQNAVYSRLTGLLEQPETPMVDPPRIMRVLILPYEDDSKVLYMPRYTYLKVEESRWVVGDYLVDGMED